MYNRCEFIGRLGADPESRSFQDGSTVVNFRLACSWKTKEKEGTEWIPVVVYGKLGTICAEYLKKGSQVFIAGSFRTRKWQDKDGHDHYATEINATEMKMLGSKPTEQRSAGKSDPFDDDVAF